MIIFYMIVLFHIFHHQILIVIYLWQFVLLLRMFYIVYRIFYKNFDNEKFIILKSNENIKQGDVWLVCYEAINNFDCSPGKEFESYSLKEKINYHLIEATLYSLH